MKKPFKDTDVGRFLKSKGFNAVISAVGTVIPGVKSLNDIKEMVIGSPEYKSLPETDQQQILQLFQAEFMILDRILDDVADARAREIKVNESEHASWLVKNTAPMLALVFVAFSIILFIMAITSTLRTTENITFMVIGSVTSITTTIIGYYFGSSRSAATKDETIRKILNNEN